MALGKVATSHETISVAGTLFDIRVITRAEAATFARMQREHPEAQDELEIAVIAAATDTPVEETREWYAATPGFAVEELLVAIKRLSRLTEEAQKSSGTSDSPGG